uniref:Integrase, catalytic region, zinc finger, CCHC-type, peptidase aspartic, catalytic n=1 Tax=Tanacetum cinerariifolium TaxID=118510 RepID=A0A699HF74_TANCI|nr:integrase, catalytic region, zinc finger, CCHC-type, peptidase aspartic, catalytic [Tanacetum cinerariifolium]
MLNAELEKSSRDSKDIQANLLKRIKIFKNDFKRSQAQSINFELKLQHQKEKMACDVSWKSKLSTIHDENVLLKTQVDSVVQKEKINSSVTRALFTTLVAAKSKNLGATSVVVKSRLSVAKTPKATNKVIRLILWIVDSGCSKHMTGNLQPLRNFIKKFMGTVIRLILWIVDSGCSKHMTGNLQPLRNFIKKFMGTVRFGNDHFAAITG